MSCRNLLGLPDRRPTFPDRLETEPSTPCIDPGGGGWFGRVAEQSPLTSYEPNNLIEISNQHADRLSFLEKQFQHRLQRRAHHCRVPQTPWMWE